MTTEANEPSMEDVLAEIKMVETPDPEPAAEPTSEEVVNTMGEAPNAPAAPAPEPPAPEPPVTTEKAPKKYETYVQNVAKLQQKLLEDKRRQQEEMAAHQKLIEQGKRFEELLRLKDQDPLRFIEEIKLEPDAVIRKMVEQEEANRELSPAELAERQQRQLMDEVEKRFQQEEEKRRIEAENRHKDLYIQQAVQNHQRLIAEVLEKNAEKFELIHTFNAQPRVWQETVNFYNQYGQVPKPEVVAEVVEELLRKEAEKLTSTKLFARLAGKENANNSKVTSNRPAVTLTNQSAKASAEIINDELDEAQAVQEALKAIRFVDE